MQALNVPVHHNYGLRPALVKGTKEIAPLTAFHDFDELGLLKNVPTLNFHPHLPHYEITEKNGESIDLARQHIDPDQPHPFTTAGNKEFNCLLCHQVMGAQETSCSSTPRTSPHCSAARTV